MEPKIAVPNQDVLCVRDMRVICRSLQHVLESSFGPKGHQTLITSATGQVTTTHDGLSILSALHLSHPVAKCIMDSVTLFFGVYGDGSKTIVLYLSEIITAIESCAASLSFVEADDPAYKSLVSKHLQEFLLEDLPKICAEVIDDSCTKTTSTLAEHEETFKNAVLYLIQTCLGGTLAKHLVEHLSVLVNKFILETGSTSEESISFRAKFIDSCTCTVSNQSFLNSYVDDGVLLQGLFHGQHSSLSDVKVIFLQCPVEGVLGSESKATLRYSSNSVEAIFGFRTQIATKFLTEVKHSGISVVITTEVVPEYVLQICDEMDIVILSHVDAADVEYLMSLTGMLPVVRVHDGLSDRNTVIATSVEPVIISGKFFLSIKLCESSVVVKWKPNYFLLCAPLESMCQQLKVLVKKCVKLVLHYFTGLQRLSVTIPNSKVSSENCNNIISGGGYFESIFIFMVQKYVKEVISPQKKFCCEILVRMFHIVPRTLHKNCGFKFKSGMNASNFLRAQKEINEKLSLQMIVGVSGQGRICNPLEYHIVEVLSIKIAAVFSTLNLVVTLMSVDSIVAVMRKNIQHRTSQDDKNDTDSDDG